MMFLSLVLKAALALLGMFSCFGVFMLAVLYFTTSNPQRSPQVCPACGQKAKNVGETFVEAGGRRSWTDGIDAEYRCRCGHHFVKRWTIASPD